MDDPSSLFFISDLLLQGKNLTVINPVGLVIQVILMLLGFYFSALFSRSEAAFFSIAHRRSELSVSADSENQGLKNLLENPPRLLATFIIGKSFTNVLATVFAAMLTASIATYLEWSFTLIFLVEVIVVAYMMMILTQIIPRITAASEPLKTALKLRSFVSAFYKLFAPLSKIIAKRILNIEERALKTENRMTSEDFMSIAEVNEQEGVKKSEEQEIIENVIEFGTTTVREIMTSRLNIVAISTVNSLEEALAQIREKGLSRMPLYETDLDNILGIIHSKDVLPYINSDIERTTINWRTIARKALFIPSTKKLDDLLRDFQQEKTHIAIVVDEYGGTEGLITLDDILEEIVGDISDEYDETEERLYTKFKSGVYVFDARIDLDDMEEILDCQLTSEEDDFETLGGLVYHLTERIPNVGERVYYQNLELTVHSVLNNRVRKLRVKLQNERPKATPGKPNTKS